MTNALNLASEDRAACVLAKVLSAKCQQVRGARKTSSAEITLRSAALPSGIVVLKGAWWG